MDDVYRTLPRGICHIQPGAGAPGVPGNLPAVAAAVAAAAAAAGMGTSIMLAKSSTYIR